MRILMLTNRYLPIVGGTERQLSILAPQLQKMGYTVRIVTRRPAPHLLAHEIIQGVAVQRLRPYGYGKLANLLMMLRVFIYLLQHRKTYDVLHVHSIGPIGVSAILASCLLSKPILLKVATEGDLRRDVTKVKGLSRFIRRYIFPPKLWRAIINQASGYITLTSSMVSEGRLMGLTVPLHLISNGVDTQFYAPAKSQNVAELRKELLLPLDSPILFLSGRLVPIKRQDVAIEALTHIRQYYPTTLMVIAGTGAQQKDSIEHELKTQVQDLGLNEAVRFIGVVENVKDYLCACDLYLLPSASEGMSNALLEAMACACPIVASDIPGVRSAVDETCARLVPVGDVDAFAQACLSLLSAPDEAQKLGILARQRIESEFSIEAIAQRYHALYQQLLGTSSTSPETTP